MKIKFNSPHPLLTILAATVIGWAFISQSVRAHGSEEATKAYLGSYEKIQTALANDDLAGAKSAASALPLDKDAQAIVAGKNLADARAAFKHISKKAIGMAADDAGYYVFKCPMVEDGYWVQTSTKCSNPYFGKAMTDCGKMLSKDEAMKMSASGGHSMPGM